MKRLIFAACFAFCAALCAADDFYNAPTVAEQYKTWSIFQLGFFPGIPSYVDHSHVIGIKTGWPISGGNGSWVDGFESSWIYSGTDRVYGLQASLFMNISKEIRGFEPAIAININRGFVTGFQASCVFNLAGEVNGIQAGALNIARSMTGFQPGVLGNITRKMCGFQAGLYNITESLDGVQAAPLFNVTKDVESTFFQMGLVNVSSGKRGVQFGLINIISDGALPFFPFFNISL